MPDIEFHCPHCKQSLTVEETGAGMVVPCPGCNEKIIVPRLEWHCPSCGKTLPQGVTHCIACDHQKQVVSAPQPTHIPTSKKCPSCQQPVDKAAVICVNCGLNLKTGEKLASDGVSKPSNATASKSETAGGVGQTWQHPKCPKCGTQVDRTGVYCMNCQGGKFNKLTRPTLKQPLSESSSMACPSCQKAVPQGTRHCAHCGFDLETRTNVQSSIAQPSPRASSRIENEVSSGIMGFNKPLVVAVVVIGLVAGAFYLGRSRSSGNQLPPTAPTPSPQPTASSLAGLFSRRGKVLIKCRVTLGSGQQIPLDGLAQLLRSDKQSYTEIMENMSKDKDVIMFAQSTDMVRQLNKKNNELLGKPGADVNVDDSPLVSSIGCFFSGLPLTKFAEAEFENGEALISDVPPGDYILYGRGRAGMNFIGFFESIKVQAGQQVVVKPKTYGTYCGTEGGLGFEHMFGSWKTY